MKQHERPEPRPLHQGYDGSGDWWMAIPFVVAVIVLIAVLVATIC